MKGSLVAACCLGSVLWAQSKPAEIPVNELVFTNVNVVDTRAGDIRPNMTVVVEDGRIKAIAKWGLIGSARNLHVVNANGKYLIPGLWDMHSHRGHVSGWSDDLLFSLYLANGVTGIRDSVDLPVSITRSPGEIVLVPHVTTTGDFAEVRRALPVSIPDKSRHSAFSLGKLLGAGATNSFLAEPPEISGDYASNDRTADPDASESLPARRTVEHLDGMILACSSQQNELEWEINKALRSHDLDAYAVEEQKAVSTYDADKAYSLFVQLAMEGTYDIPALVWSQAVANLGSPAFTNDVHLKYVPRTVRNQWSPDVLLRRTSPQLRATFKERAEQDLKMMNVIRRAGLQVLSGTGAPGPYVIPGFALHDELELLVQSGFTPLQALQSATFTPALFMAKLDHYGVVEPGRDADLVLLDDNPLTDIHNLSRISAVVMAGKYLSRSDLDHMLTHAAELAKGTP
jgi:hypothetical protein